MKRLVFAVMVVTAAACSSNWIEPNKGSDSGEEPTEPGCPILVTEVNPDNTVSVTDPGTGGGGGTEVTDPGNGGGGGSDNNGGGGGSDTGSGGGSGGGGGGGEDPVTDGGSGGGNGGGETPGNGNGNNDDKVCICHVPKGKPGNAHTICIGEPALSAHLKHNDYLGPCVGGN